MPLPLLLACRAPCPLHLTRTRTYVRARLGFFFLFVLFLFSSRNFFKYYKVNLDQECPFWEEDGQCMMKDCSVCECSPEEIPKPWLEEVCCVPAVTQKSFFVPCSGRGAFSPEPPPATLKRCKKFGLELSGMIRRPGQRAKARQVGGPSPQRVDLLPPPASVAGCDDHVAILPPDVAAAPTPLPLPLPLPSPSPKGREVGGEGSGGRAARG